MALKDFLTKILLGSDIHEDLAMAEKVKCETQNKYNNATNATDALEKECSSLEKAINSLTLELKNLNEEQVTLDECLNLSLQDEESNDVQTVLRKMLERKTKIDNLVVQRKGIRDNLTTLKDEWQNTLDVFKTKITNADSQKYLNELINELKDYERRINNAIEISVK